MKPTPYALSLLLIVGLWSCDRDDAPDFADYPAPGDALFTADPGVLGSDENGLTPRDPKGVDLFISEGTGFYDGFEAGCWHARTHKRDSTGSCSSGPEWLGSQMQAANSGLVVDELLYFEDGEWKNAKPREGNYAMRFRWTKDRYDMSDDNNTKKAHLWTPFEFTRGATRSYGFSMFLPSGPAHMSPDSESEILIQWKGYPDLRPANAKHKEPFRVPALSFKHTGENLTMEYWFDQRWMSRTSDWIKTYGENWIDINNELSNWFTWQRGHDEEFIDFGKVELNKWIDFTVKVTWSPEGNGALQVRRKYQDELSYTTLYDTSGIHIGYNDASDPNVGVGLYKYTASSNYRGRQFYFDAFKFGKSSDDITSVEP